VVGKRTAAFGAAVLVSLPVIAGLAAESDEPGVGRASASGEHAVATALATTSRMPGFTARVTASPDQQVGGRWGVVCRLRSKDVVRGTGHFAGRTPLTVDVPFRAASAKSCTITGTASLAGSGKVTVEIRGR
jgi:hypothetical protein